MTRPAQEQDLSELSIKRRRMMTYFIEAAEALLKEEGIEGATVRKIASRAGYNSATLYNYFSDLEHLILYASVCHLRDYVAQLRVATRGMTDTLELYRTSYVVFNQYSFRSPEIFYNMFFGRSSHKLKEVLQQYYQLFPQELEAHQGLIRSILEQGDIYTRDLAFMEALVEEGRIRPERKLPATQLTVRLNQSFLHQACIQGDKLNLYAHNQAFMELFDYIIETAR